MSWTVKGVVALAEKKPAELVDIVIPDPGPHDVVVDIKATDVESPEQVARGIERAEKVLGAGRVRYIHPDCGFWMLKRSIADAKMRALVLGRDLFEGVTAQ